MIVVLYFYDETTNFIDHLINYGQFYFGREINVFFIMT